MKPESTAPSPRRRSCAHGRISARGNWPSISSRNFPASCSKLTPRSDGRRRVNGSESPPATLFHRAADALPVRDILQTPNGNGTGRVAKDGTRRRRRARRQTRTV